MIGLTGLQASGKSLFAEVARQQNYYVLDMSSVLKLELEKTGLQETANNLSDLAKMLREKYGMSIIAEKCDQLIKKHETQKTLVTGIRSWEEAVYFRKKYPGFVLVAVLSNMEDRYERVKKIGKYGIKHWDEFSERDKRDIEELGVAKCIALADQYVVNDSTTKIFKQKVEKLLEQL